MADIDTGELWLPTTTLEEAEPWREAQQDRAEVTGPYLPTRVEEEEEHPLEEYRPPERPVAPRPRHRHRRKTARGGSKIATKPAADKAAPASKAAAPAKQAAAPVKQGTAPSKEAAPPAPKRTSTAAPAAPARAAAPARDEARPAAPPPTETRAGGTTVRLDTPIPPGGRTATVPEAARIAGAEFRNRGGADYAKAGPRPQAAPAHNCAPACAPQRTGRA